MVVLASRELIPLYGLYAVLFRVHGVTPTQLAALFVLWSGLSFLFEVPSGAWADSHDPRRVLAAAGVVKAVAMALWTWWPTVHGFAGGFALWALSSAAMSGTFEAYVHDSLATAGRADRYATFIGRAQAVAMVATLVGVAAGGPLFAFGGFALVGTASVIACLASALAALGLPPRPPRSDDADDDPGYLAALRAGWAEASQQPPVRRAVVVAALAVGLTAFDEFFPLVAQEQGAAPSAVALLVAVPTAAQVAGTALAGRAAALGPRPLGVLYAGGGVAVAAGAVLGGWVGFAVLGLGYGVLNNVMLVTETRLQAVITTSARATVTSVHGAATELVALIVYAAFGLGGSRWTTATLLVVAVIPALGIGARLASPTRGLDAGPSPRSTLGQRSALG